MKRFGPLIRLMLMPRRRAILDLSSFFAIVWLIALVKVIEPYILSQGLDAIMVERPGDRSAVMLAYASLWLGGAALSYYCGQQSARFVQKCASKIRLSLARTLLSSKRPRPSGGFGNCFELITADADSAGLLVSTVLGVILGNAVLVLLAVIAVFLSSREVGTVMTTYVIIMGLLQTGLVLGNRKANAEVRNLQAAQSAAMEELTNGAWALTVGRERRFVQRWFRSALESFSHREVNARIRNLAVYQVGWIGFCFGTSLTLGVGWWAWRNGTVSVGEVLRFHLLFNVMRPPMEALLNGIMMVQSCMPGLLRVTAALNQKIDSNQEARLATSFCPIDIEISQVWFRYDKKNEWLLKGLNAKFHSNQFTLLLGPSGQGKTTILKMIAGQIEPSSGAVSFLESGGISITGVPFSQISLIERDMVDCPGTLLENIYGGEQPNGEPALELVMRDVGLHRLKEKIWPLLYSNWKDCRSDFSPREIQTLNLLRACFSKCAILLLDECTSSMNLDGEDHQIVTLLRYIASSRTMILVSHQEELKPHADQAFRLLDGQLVAANS